MSLTLTTEQLSIMSGVREKLRAKERGENNRGSAYICNQIYRVVAERIGAVTDSGKTILSYKQHPGAHEKILELQEAIHAALDGFNTVEGYLCMKVPSMNYVKVDDVYAPIARLAWLDRMIETGVIA